MILIEVSLPGQNSPGNKKTLSYVKDRVLTCGTTLFDLNMYNQVHLSQSAITLLSTYAGNRVSDTQASSSDNLKAFPLALRSPLF